MSETKRLAELLRRSYDGDAWAGWSLRLALEGVDPEAAASHPIEGAHSIWELAAHATAWTEVVRRRVLGEPVAGPDEGDWPEVGPITKRNWSSLMKRLDARQKTLAKTVLGLGETRLDEPASPGYSTVYNQIHGLTQHNLYHSAQIVLLRHALGIPVKG